MYYYYIYTLFIYYVIYFYIYYYIIQYILYIYICMICHILLMFSILFIYWKKTIYTLKILL